MKKAFTFIEMVVVIGIMSIALPTLYAIFFIILQQQVKIVRLAEIKNQGQFVINTIEKLVRNDAASIYSDSGYTTRVCAVVFPAVSLSATTNPDTPSLYFKDKRGYSFYFDPSGSPEKIASKSAGPSVDLTSSKVIISNFVTSCTVSGYSSPVVTVSFDICYNTNAISPSCGTNSEKVSLEFQTTVALPHY